MLPSRSLLCAAADRKDDILNKTAEDRKPRQHENHAIGRRFSPAATFGILWTYLEETGRLQNAVFPRTGPLSRRERGPRVHNLQKSIYILHTAYLSTVWKSALPRSGGMAIFRLLIRPSRRSCIIGGGRMRDHLYSAWPTCPSALA